MTQTKDPAAPGTPAGSAVAQGEEVSQLDLFEPLLVPAHDSVATRPPRVRGVRRSASTEGGREERENSSGSCEENYMRRPRTNRRVSLAAIKRTIGAVSEAGVPIQTISVHADGTIVIGAAQEPTASVKVDDDIFTTWASRL